MSSSSSVKKATQSSTVVHDLSMKLKNFIQDHQKSIFSDTDDDKIKKWIESLGKMHNKSGTSTSKVS